MVTAFRSFPISVFALLPLVAFTQAFVVSPVQAQTVAVAVEASVLVEGRVENIFQSENQSLVQILVLKSELASLANAARASYPAPGEYVYVHVSADNSVVSRFGRRVAGDGLPKPQTEVLASLQLDASGQWAAEGRDWFQAASAADSRSANNRLPANDGGTALGLVTQPVNLGRETGLKVVSVTPDSPAAAAGIEPGDTLVQVNRQPLESQRQLDDVFRRSARGISLTVRDVRSGRDVEVAVATTAKAANAGEMRSLGVTSKLAFVSGKPALEITAVEPGSPAQRAGLVVGLLITQANGKEVGSPEALEAAERESRGRLELDVVDPKDRRVRTVTVSL